MDTGTQTEECPFYSATGLQLVKMYWFINLLSTTHFCFYSDMHWPEHWHQIDGETLMSLDRRMVEQLIPIPQRSTQLHKMNPFFVSFWAWKHKSNCIIVSSQLQQTAQQNGTPIGLQHDISTGQQQVTSISQRVWPPVFRLPGFPAVFKLKWGGKNCDDLHRPTVHSKWRSQIVQVLA